MALVVVGNDVQVNMLFETTMMHFVVPWRVTVGTVVDIDTVVMVEVVCVLGGVGAQFG
jgi:hypothetical protein